MKADAGPGAGDTARVFTREQLAEAWAFVPDRQVRFPERAWQQIELRRLVGFVLAVERPTPDLIVRFAVTGA
jgi:hypothetical protein